MATARRKGHRKPGSAPSPLTRGVATALCGAMAGAPTWAQSGVQVSDLVGASVASGQSELRNRGFALVHSDTTGHTSWQYWWNGARSQCVLATANEGRFIRLGQGDEHDCNQQPAAPAGQPAADASPGISDGAKVAIGAAGLLGVFALLHKSHERKKDRDKSSAHETAEFERGYRDGLYHQGYHNYNNHREYVDGYSAGSEKRSNETRYRTNEGHHSGYAAYVNVNDLVGARACRGRKRHALARFSQYQRLQGQRPRLHLLVEQQHAPVRERRRP